jgi:hypothetical protein
MNETPFFAEKKVFAATVFSPPLRSQMRVSVGAGGRVLVEKITWMNVLVGWSVV